jgi:hypothetical protein
VKSVKKSMWQSRQEIDVIMVRNILLSIEP